ncbi:MAG TPA: MFS transporter [Sulfurovum sp.]|jgi:MFS family permease|nr:MAG: MFS transporter [Sulfurovum sp. 35-42-20]OYY57509.1 MAG: MFS transporter [Sulfurovum sp. 28-43-6]OYZ26024.1 MAG: MFS transporter [Sulfurovum sp. 16-42-52]OYZ50414.1 MAG: MFS transporter [Sulfurovum sp. 24-42-9]OZA46040.1 MAG: MFS transporter [Sulfurovum sp. 17-42-90]OZA60301.1 MAG: MFS transporter [Sulfurovum sp. 39-42-12]HQR73383.1 MFS transporter [Sulfurovum sp.]
MTYLETLKHPIIRRLSLIQFISYFGTWFSQVAIFSMIVAYGADEITIALTAAMAMFPAVVLAPLIGIIIDRIEFKKLMLTLLLTEITMTIGFIFIDSLESVWVLMLLIFLRSSAASMLFSAEMTLFPKLVQGEMLKNTNEIHSIIWSVCYALGMAVGGLATHSMGFDTAFMVDALLYSIAVLLLLGLQLRLERIVHVDSGWQMFKDGFAYLVSQKKILHLLLLHASIGLTSFDALITLLADVHYKELLAVPLSIGWMNATRALGLMIGPFIISKIISKHNLHYFFIIQGLAIMLWAGLEYNFYLALVGLFVTGFFITTLWSYTYLLIQEETDPAFMGRVISYNDMFFMLSNVATALFIGYAAEWGFSLEGITFTLGLGFIMTAMYYLWFKKQYLDEEIQ